MPISEKFIQRWGKVTEEYKFYNDEVVLRYDVKAHKYFLLKDGVEELQDGVTTVVHIIDKSEVLMNWAVKVMAQKLFDTTPSFELPTGERFVPQMEWSKYEKLVLEAKKAKDEHLETAGAVGHEAHDWTEKFIKATLGGNEGRRLELLAKFPEDERARNACLAALEWMSKHNVRWRATEQKIYSREYRYAGTMDGLAVVDSCDDPSCCPKEFKDRLSIIDWKTSNYLYLEYLLQTAAYQHAFNEMEMYRLGMNVLTYWLSTSDCVTDRWVIRLGKDNAEFDPWHMTLADYEQDFECFKDAFTLGRHVEAIKQRIKAKEDAARAIIKQEKLVKKAAKEAAEAEQKADAKEKKAKARLEALEKACPKSKTFKGSRAPNCDTASGNPCEACTAIYAAKHPIVESSPIENKKKDSLKTLLELIKPQMHESVPVINGIRCYGKDVPCDGEHGAPACNQWNCWQGHDCLETYYKCIESYPQKLLTAGHDKVYCPEHGTMHGYCSECVLLGLTRF